MSRIWERPYACDRWEITSSCVGRTLFRRREQWRATAVGYRSGDAGLHVRYDGFMSGEVGYGATREEAERDMRRIICRDVKAYGDWLAARDFRTAKFDRENVCPC